MLTVQKMIDGAANMAAEMVKKGLYSNYGLAIHIAARKYYGSDEGKAFQMFRTMVSKELSRRYKVVKRISQRRAS